jgi:hypothetical protein
VDTLTILAGVAILVILVTPIIEIALKRPEIFLELNAGTRAFAEAPLRDSGTMETVAEDRTIPANGSKTGTTRHTEGERLAA